MFMILHSRTCERNMLSFRCGDPDPPDKIQSTERIRGNPRSYKVIPNKLVLLKPTTKWEIDL